MFSRRFIRSRVRRKKKSILELEITSLLDILVILLIFMIKNYNTSSVDTYIPKEITVPTSESMDIIKEGVIIQMSKKKQIWVDNESVVDLGKGDPDDLDIDGNRIIALFNVLVTKRERIENLHRQANRALKFSGIINLIMEESLSYEIIRKVMFTATEAGFKEFKFVVLGQDQ